MTPEEIEQLAQKRWGLDFEWRGRELHGPCPKCGGRDRFWINERGHFQCRQCAYSGWLEEVAPTPERIAEWQEQARLNAVRREGEIAQRLAELRTQAERDAYRLGRDDERQWIAREYFTHEGISVASIERYGLGYTPDHTVRVGEGFLNLPAYTIPIRDPHNGLLVNMQYRLQDPPPQVGKYQQVHGLPAASFFAEDTLTGEAIVVEGAKKAIVVHEFTGMQTVGLPGNTPSRSLITQLMAFDEIVLMLDPGSEEAVKRITRLLPSRVGVTALPGKPDDLIVKDKMTHAQWDAFLSHARWGNT